MFSIKYYKDYLLTSAIIRWKALLDRLAFRRTTNFTKFVILSHPRTGSTLLHTYLNSHVSVRSLGELPREKYRAGQQELLLDEHAFFPRTSLAKAVGFKMFYKYEHHPFFQHIHKQILEDKNIKVIHIVRKDFLALYLSLFKAKESGHWSYAEGSKNEKKSIRISIEHFKEERDKYIESIKHFDQMFSDHDKMTIDYENLLEQREATLNDIQVFLKVPRRSLFSVLRKQGSIDYKSDIVNIDEVLSITTTDIKGVD